MSLANLVSIVDYGMGNIRSIQNALDFIGVNCRVTDSPEDIAESQKLILPGVGSFRLAMKNIIERRLFEVLGHAVMVKKIPVLGICLGMQLFMEESEEDGITNGFGWVRGLVKRFPSDKLSIKIPHIGYNSAFFTQGPDNLFEGLGNKADFYFVHSYRVICKNPDFVSSWTMYGERFASSVQRENIFGTQFHPEKSQSNGLTVLKNFCSLDKKW
jgi:glutamine amidotransferase